MKDIEASENTIERHKCLAFDAFVCFGTDKIKEFADGGRSEFISH
jgi:hypothetical protein